MTAGPDSVGQRAGRGACRGTWILATLAVAYALYLGHEVLVPVSLALVLVALLAPAVAWLARHRVPAPAGAALTVVASLVLLVGAGATLAPPLRDLGGQLPRSLAMARARLARLQAPLARLGLPVPAAGPSPAPPARSPSDSGAPPASAPPASAPPASGPPSGVLAVVGRTFGVTTGLLAELVEVLLLAFFLLAGERSWGDKLARAVSDPSRRRATADAAAEMRRVVARYVLVTACINVGQGVVVGLAMWALGVPSPALWGALTFVLEFVPYLGGLVMVVLLVVAGLAAGGTLLHAILAPAAYLTITTIQNNLVSPAAYGRGLRLNPAAILLAVMVWYAAWGVAGAFLAVPILAVLRVVCTHVPALASVGVFLEE